MAGDRGNFIFSSVLISCLFAIPMAIEDFYYTTISGKISLVNHRKKLKKARVTLECNMPVVVFALTAFALIVFPVAAEHTYEICDPNQYYSTQMCSYGGKRVKN